MKEKVKIKTGQIWKVVTDKFLTSGEKTSARAGNRRILLKKGEIIEIRYPYAWHFRTEDNLYFHAYPDEILTNCRLVGTIRTDVITMNRASLKDILRLHLYKKAYNNEIKRKSKGDGFYQHHKK